MTLNAEPLTTLSFDGHVAIITLNEPTKINAISPAMIEVLQAVLE